MTPGGLKIIYCHRGPANDVKKVAAPEVESGKEEEFDSHYGKIRKQKHPLTKTLALTHSPPEAPAPLPHMSLFLFSSRTPRILQPSALRPGGSSHKRFQQKSQPFEMPRLFQAKDCWKATANSDRLVPRPLHFRTDNVAASL